VVLQGKHAVGTVFQGELVSLSENGAELRSLHSLEILSNLKLKLLTEPELPTEDADIYAKVIKQSTGDEDYCRIRFTAVPPKAIALLKALRDADSH
jgi:adenylate cyclase